MACQFFPWLGVVVGGGVSPQEPGWFALGKEGTGSAVAEVWSVLTTAPFYFQALVFLILLFAMAAALSLARSRRGRPRGQRKQPAASALGVPLLGQIPARSPNSQDLASSLFSSGDHEIPGTVREAFRGLKEAMDSTRVPKGPVLFCAAEPGGGSSFCAAHLARIFAESGQRTLLVDADWRRPSPTGSLLELPARAGLLEFMRKQAGFANILQPTRQLRLDMVAAGLPGPSLPNGTHFSERFGELLREAAPLYDRIIVDSPALTATQEMLSCAPLFAVVAFVARAEEGRAESYRQSIEKLQRAGANFVGLVLNQPVPPKNDPKSSIIETTPSPLAPAASPGNASAIPATSLNPRLAPRGMNGKSTPGALASPNPRFVSLVAQGRRDVSPAGCQKRLVFGELLCALEKTGMSPEEARQFLLLQLKIWSNDASEQSHASHAALERARLLSELTERLVESGNSPAKARARLTEALDAWRAQSH